AWDRRRLRSLRGSFARRPRRGYTTAHRLDTGPGTRRLREDGTHGAPAIRVRVDRPRRATYRVRRREAVRRGPGRNRRPDRRRARAVFGPLRASHRPEPDRDATGRFEPHHIVAA